jgi:hypothetical protein
MRAADDVREFVGDPVEGRRHQIEERAACEAERSPVEVVVGNQADVPVPAAAVELDAVDRGMTGAGKTHEPAEGRERDGGLAAGRASERVPAPQNVVHALQSVVQRNPDAVHCPLRASSTR